MISYHYGVYLTVKVSVIHNQMSVTCKLNTHDVLNDQSVPLSRACLYKIC
jgi:hypothetical protein